MEKIHLRNGRQSIEGTLVLPNARREIGAAAILVHGLGSSRKGYVEIAQRLASNGVAALAIDLRGHGQHEGNLSKLGLDDAVYDGLLAHNYLIQAGIADRERVGFAGASLGGLVAALVSSEVEVSSLVLRAPATYTEKIRKEMTFQDILNTQGHLFHEIEDIASTCGILAIRKFGGSLLVIVSGKDEIIPRRICDSYFENANAAKLRKMVVIDGAKHALEPQYRETFIGSTVESFAKTL